MDNAGGMLDLEKMIKSLSENEGLADILNAVKESASAHTYEEKADSPETEKAPSDNTVTSAADKLPELMSALGPLMKGKGSGGIGSKDTENRNRLLSALKPYVSSSRRDMIDKIMSLSKITGILDIVSDAKH